MLGAILWVMTQRQAMAWNYVKGWFFIDLGSCSSLLQYVYMITDNGDSGAVSKTKSLKSIRLLRMAKLLRLARIKRVLDRLDDEVLRVLAPIWSLLALILGMGFAMHLISVWQQSLHQQQQLGRRQQHGQDTTKLWCCRRRRRHYCCKSPLEHLLPSTACHAIGVHQPKAAPRHW